MKIPKTLCIVVFALLSADFGTLAAAVADAAGTWRIINFSTPDRFTVRKDSQGVVIGIDEAEHFESSTGIITVSPDGTFSGSVPDAISGTIALGDQGELLLNATTVEGPQSLTFHINSTADLMATAHADSGYKELILALRAPASVVAADLAGQWNAAAFQTPHRLVLEKNASNQVINIRGLDSFKSFGGTMTIDADGTMSGQIGDPFTGAIDSTGNGLVNATINTGEGAMSLTFFVNASKDVMALLQSNFATNDNYQEIMIFQKAPTNNVVSELAAHWRIVTFDTPMTFQVKDGQGRVTGLGGTTSFGASRQSLVSGYDGFFIAQVEGTALGTLSPTQSGHVTVNVQSQDGADTFDFQLNSSQTLLSSSRSIGDGYELLLVTRSAPVSGPTRNYGMVTIPEAAGVTVYWAAATNAALQISTNLMNWQTLSNTVGQHTYTAPTNGPSANFYRVIQPIP